MADAKQNKDQNFAVLSAMLKVGHETQAEA